MSTKHAKTLMSLSATEIELRLKEVQSELFQLKIQKSTGQLSNTSRPRGLRKDMARLRMSLVSKKGGA